jgi:hemerythrin-like domain-containing protein
MGEAGRRAASLLEHIPDNLLREPVDFLYAEHYRQLVLYDLIDDLARSGAAGESASIREAVIGYLRRDIPHHMIDEEQDLFPRLRRRLRPEDGAEAILDFLSETHRMERRSTAAVIELLRRADSIGGPDGDPWTARSLSAFAENQRRHLAWENGLVLPLARRRLTRADLAVIGHNMARRRDIDFPE